MLAAHTQQKLTQLTPPPSRDRNILLPQYQEPFNEYTTLPAYFVLLPGSFNNLSLQTCVLYK